MADGESNGNNNDGDMTWGENPAMLSPTTKSLHKMVQDSNKRLKEKKDNNSKLSSIKINQARRRMIAMIDEVINNQHCKREYV